MNNVKKNLTQSEVQTLYDELSNMVWNFQSHAESEIQKKAVQYSIKTLDKFKDIK